MSEREDNPIKEGCFVEEPILDPGETKTGNPLKVICAWCGKEIGEKEGEGIDGITHSICEECLEKYFPKVAQKIRRQTERWQLASSG